NLSNIIICQCLLLYSYYSMFFCLNDTATIEIYTLSLHDALPILTIPVKNVRERISDMNKKWMVVIISVLLIAVVIGVGGKMYMEDRKSTRLNSSHVSISYAVFCLKKKNTRKYTTKEIVHVHDAKQ